MALAEHHRRRHPQLTARRLVRTRRRRFRLFQLRQDPGRIREQTPAGLGQGDVTRGAGEQPGADPPLQRRHQPRHRRGRQVHLPRRRVEGAGLRHRDKRREFPEAIHNSRLLNYLLSTLHILNQSESADL